jgi:hypothetical protein
MILTIISSFVLIVFSLTVNVKSQTCQGTYQYAQCSSNSACGCLSLPFADNIGICALLGVSCSRLSPCQSDDSCEKTDHICVRHPQCDSRPLCYPLTMTDQRLCPSTTVVTSTIPTTTGYPGSSTWNPTSTTTGYPGSSTWNPTSTTTRYPGSSTWYPTVTTTGYPGPSTWHQGSSTWSPGSSSWNPVTTTTMATMTTTEPALVVSKYSSALRENSKIYSRVENSTSKTYYESIHIIPITSGFYNLTSVSNIDTFGALYQGNFNPLYPSHHLRQEDDDSAGNNQFRLTAFLESNLNYILVVTTYAGLLTGPFSVDVSGPGSVYFILTN